MSGEIQLDYAQTGKNVYAIVANPAGLLWNGAAFEAPLTANWANYAIVLAEQSTTGFYEGSFPAGIVTAGRYSVAVRLRAGGAPATTDSIIGAGLMDWTGAAQLVLTGDAFAQIGVAGVGLTNLGDTRIAELAGANIPADVDTLLTRVPGVVQPQTGDSFARIGAGGASLNAIPDSTTLTEVGADVDELITTVAPAGMVLP